MRLKDLLLITIIVQLHLFTTNAIATEIKYDRNEAAKYAKDYCQNYNHDKYKCWNGDKAECRDDNPWISKDEKKCKDRNGNSVYCCRDSSGNPQNCHVDCANFASQELIAAGLNFGCVKNTDVIGKDGWTKGEPSVSELTNALQKSFCFKPVHYLMAQPGDILSYKAYSHVVIYTGDGKYCGHTNDKCGDNINWAEVTD